MGIPQCNSISDGKVTFEYLERTLPKGNSSIEQLINNEYSEIKKSLYKKQIEQIEPYFTSINEKNLCDYREITKRRDVFIKWSTFLILPFSTKPNSNSSISKVLEENLMNYKERYNQDFNDLVLSSPPNSIRWLSWVALANIPLSRDEKLYEDYLNEDINPITEEQIRKDLHRTFFNNNDMEMQKSSLYNVLRAFSNQDKEVAYCQGMNFIVAFLLQTSKYNEVDTFFLLSHLFGEIRGFYSDDFPLLKAYLYIFSHYFEKLLPKLNEHFNNLEIPKELWIGKWIQTMYTICLPLEISQRFWDCFISYGIDFIIPLSLSLMQSMDKKLLEFKDSSEIIIYFKEVFMPGEFQLKTKNISNHVIIVDKVIYSAKRLYKSMNKSSINCIKKEFEQKFNVNLDEIRKKYNMSLKRTHTFSSTSSDYSHKFRFSNNASSNNKSHPSSAFKKMNSGTQNYQNNEIINQNKNVIKDDNEVENEGECEIDTVKKKLNLNYDQEMPYENIIVDEIEISNCDECEILNEGENDNRSKMCDRIISTTFLIEKSNKRK